MSFDYNGAIQKAGQLRACAAELSGLQNTVRGLSNSIDNGWPSAATKIPELAATFNLTVSEVVAIANELNSIASSIETKAREIKAAEEEAARRAAEEAARKRAAEEEARRRAEEEARQRAQAEAAAKAQAQAAAQAAQASINKLRRK